MGATSRWAPSTCCGCATRRGGRTRARRPRWARSSLAWTADSTQVAAGTGCGQVLFGQLVHRELSCGSLEVRQEDPHALTVINVMDDSREELQFKDCVTEMSLSTTHLVVVTATQCCIYATSNWNTPHIIELKGTVSLILLCERHFLLVDTINGLQIINYDGRIVSTPKFQAMRPDALSTLNVGYSSDLLAVIGHADPKVVMLLDPLTGRQLGTVTHSIDIEQVALSQRGDLSRRRLVIVDKNRDLYLTPVQGAQELVKLHIMVDTVAWNAESDALAAVADGQLLVWAYPEVVYMDRDLLPATLAKQPADWGKTCEIIEFRETRVQVRRSDGAVVCAWVSPYPAMLEQFCGRSEWEPALRLCRYVKRNELWACLAAMAIAGKELHTAEVAYAAIEQVDKLLYMCHIKELPTIEAREAELLLFRRRMPEAIGVLVQGGWIYRAIKMCIRLYQWEKAYDLSRQHQQHVDTVLMYRQKYLISRGAEETIPKLATAAQQFGQLDEEAIRAKIDAEKERERERGGQGTS